MKKYITILMIFAFIFPTTIIKAQESNPENTEGYMQEQAENLVIITSNPKIPKILSTNILTLVEADNSSIDLSTANIYWQINGKWSESGVGLTTYNLSIGPYTNQIKVKARIQYTNDTGRKTYYDAETTIRPGIENKSGDPNEKFVAETESNGLKIKIIPSSPRAFQRVVFQAIPDRGNNCNVSEATFEWQLDGKTVDEGTGKDKYVIRIIGPSDSGEISVQSSDCGSAKTKLVAKSNSKYYLQQNTATRVLNCEAQYVMMLNSNFKSLEREVNKFIETTEKAYDNIEKDTAFLEDTIDDLGKDWDLTKDMFDDVKDAFTKPSLKSIASGLKSLSNLILRNPFSQRIEYIRRQIDYYTDLINWYNNYQYRLQAQLDSLGTRIKKQQERCLEMTQQEFDFNLRNTSELNDFKKYEW